MEHDSSCRLHRPQRRTLPAFCFHAPLQAHVASLVLHSLMYEYNVRHVLCHITLSFAKHISYCLKLSHCHIILSFAGPMSHASSCPIALVIRQVVPLPLSLAKHILYCVLRCTHIAYCHVFLCQVLPHIFRRKPRL